MWDCGSKLSMVSEEVRLQWITIRGFDDVEKPRILIDKNVLSLSLKLQQLVESTPLAIKKGSAKFTDLGPKYSLGEEKPDWFTVSLVCECDLLEERGLSIAKMVSLSRVSFELPSQLLRRLD